MDKPFEKMTLDEVFDFAERHSSSISRSVVSESGLKRHRRQSSAVQRRLRKRMKRAALGKPASR